MMRLYFVRHGESEANLLNEISNRGLKHGLTERGRAQASALAETLRQAQIQQLYASPLLRAQQTAEILARALGVTAATTAALCEYDCGIAEGRADAGAWALYNEAAEAWQRGDWTSCIDGGESILDMEARFRPFLDRLIAEHQQASGAVVLIGHGGLYRWMLPRVLSNVGLDFVLAHPISYTGTVVAEVAPAGLICRMWCGLEL
jgi:broad specificity phosphatase PhoE